MLVSAISKSKLHCCLTILIVFILIFLSLPLLLIYLANTRYEEWQNQRSQANSPSSSISSGKSGGVAGNQQQQQQQQQQIEINSEIQNPFASQQTVNCTEHALKHNLTLIDNDVHCPEGSFPCQSCRQICIEQSRNCNGVADCPDKSDESGCHDSNGAMKKMYKSLANAIHSKNQTASSHAKFLAIPKSCSFEQFVNETCPCVTTDANVVICEGLGLDHVPNTLLSSVYKIRMSNNSIVSIDNVLWPENLSSLVLVDNHITSLGRATFESAPILSKIYLSHNEISYIHPDAFTGLTSLTSLQIEANQLDTFDTGMCHQTPALTKIYMSENKIELPISTRFSACQNLKELLLDHNQITVIRSGWFSNMTKLIWLSLTHNQISVIENGAFNWDYELEELNLSFNKIKVIHRLMFFKKLNIQRLYLGGNPLEPLAMDAFREVVHLRSLNLTSVEFSYINRGTFSYLTQLDFIYFAKFHYCHYATHVRVCRPLTDGLSSSEELLAFPILKYAVWIVASVCCLGNVFVFIWRSISSHEDRTLSLFVRNLSIADLMMGIYLGAIGWQDWKFQHKFGRYAIEWMSSSECALIGFLAILSSELSVFILLIITIERYRSITSISKFEEGAQKVRAKVYVSLAWICSFLIALYPNIESLLRRSDYYATNGLCLPLHIDQPFTPGWQYSAFVYLGINFSAVMIIIILYILMYTMILDGRQVARPVVFKAEKREDAILAIRFFFIVVTDCLCWIPIVVIKIIALANVSISSSIYGWLVVFIIPINSALNPIVYTLAAPTYLRAAVCRLFERIWYEVDLLTSGSTHSTHSSTSGSRHSDSEMVVVKRLRKNGSNSTTCDTYETSIGGNHSQSTATKTSVESTLIQIENGLSYAVTRLKLPLIRSPSAAATKPAGGGGGGAHNDESAVAKELNKLARFAAAKTSRQAVNDNNRINGASNKIQVEDTCGFDLTDRRVTVTSTSGEHNVIIIDQAPDRLDLALESSRLIPAQYPPQSVGSSSATLATPDKMERSSSLGCTLGLDPTPNGTCCGALRTSINFYDKPQSKSHDGTPMSTDVFDRLSNVSIDVVNQPDRLGTQQEADRRAGQNRIVSFSSKKITEQHSESIQ